MNCPYCNHDFPLTWSRYARASVGKYVCPSCGKPAKLKVTLPYLVAIFSMFVAVLLMAIVATEIVLPPEWRSSKYLAGHLIVVGIVSLAIVIPFDRYCDERMNWLVKLPASERHSD